MFSTLIGAGVVVLQIAIVVFVILWITKSPLLEKVYNHSGAILATIFISSAIGSIVYEYVLGFEPCLLCWYQRIAIFGIAILSLTGKLKTNRTLQNQVIVFSVLGLIVALLHNYIDIFPSGLDICGTGVSCLKRYVAVFGYITIPMMSFTVLLSGLLLSIFIKKHSPIALE
jgi:disulfide bond formation protein DsbB